ncbi:MAG: GNAT family N-acetyltransferase [Actinomycetota bacterium]|nr:GNAT family N-acetyltransferase [Actinomycetota bacterium]
MTRELHACPASTLDRFEVDALGRVLSQAFFDDPVYSWLFPNPANRRRQLHAFFKREIRYRLRTTQVILDAEHRAVAFWHPPGTWNSSVRAVGVVPAFVSLIGPRAWRAYRLLLDVDARHPSDAHWYLSHLAVSSSVRSLGIGTQLVCAGLELADADATGTYLETANPANVAFYRRNGFESTGTVTVAGAPAIETMWRPPHPTSGSN